MAGEQDPWTRLSEAQRRNEVFREALDTAARSIQEAVSQAEATIRMQFDHLRPVSTEGEGGMRPAPNPEANMEAAVQAFAQARKQVADAVELYQGGELSEPGPPPHVPGIPPVTEVDPVGNADQLMHDATRALNEAMTRLVTSTRPDEHS